jgi:hypothetical protein
MRARRAKWRLAAVPPAVAGFFLKEAYVREGAE